ncbi:uncharacterized protein PSFLO_00416 [Pseudozyma flocculosa]|uniref:Uncharacterized protein n=1 Tax=Pseudozyma flocculosa TaxID=84751 RepID=A0A5C3ETE9_9BASI|nr:uncharacterized protein PSFLO_00416 [Pseudozyma flocculosa]
MLRMRRRDSPRPGSFKDECLEGMGKSGQLSRRQQRVATVYGRWRARMRKEDGRGGQGGEDSLDGRRSTADGQWAEPRRTSSRLAAGGPGCLCSAPPLRRREAAQLRTRQNRPSAAILLWLSNTTQARAEQQKSEARSVRWRLDMGKRAQHETGRSAEEHQDTPPTAIITMLVASVRYHPAFLLQIKRSPLGYRLSTRKSPDPETRSRRPSLVDLSCTPPAPHQALPARYLQA